MSNILDQLVEDRRKFRKIAEVGFLEMQTTIEIIKILKSLGYEVKYGKSIHSDRMGVPSESVLKEHASKIDISNLDFDPSEILEGYTGCIADLDTNKPGPKIAFRTDIDALPLHETDSLDHIPNKLNFRSLDKNVTHACGHDGHISIGLGLCRYLMENKDNLKGSFRVIFQPAEEGVRGGKSLTGAGCAKDVDYMIGSHIGMGAGANTVGVGTANFLATRKFDISYRGVSAHAAANPQDGRNALLGAATLALALHSLPQYGNGMSRVNVGTLTAGSGRNVIAQDSFLQVEIRGGNNEILEDLTIKTEKATKGIAETYGLEYIMETVGGAVTFDTIHPEFVDYVNDSLIKKGYKTILRPNLGGSEDISYMLKETEDNGGYAIHFLWGTNLKAPHHNEAFDYDEDTLNLALNTYIDLISIIHNRH